MVTGGVCWNEGGGKKGVVFGEMFTPFEWKHSMGVLECRLDAVLICEARTPTSCIHTDLLFPTPMAISSPSSWPTPVYPLPL
jgi:hypothetical protein